MPPFPYLLISLAHVSLSIYLPTYLPIQQPNSPMQNAIDAVLVDGTDGHSSTVSDPGALDAARVRLLAVGDGVEVGLQPGVVVLGVGQVALGGDDEPRLRGDVQAPLVLAVDIVVVVCEHHLRAAVAPAAGAVALPVDAALDFALLLLVLAHAGVEADFGPEGFEGGDGVAGAEVDDEGEDAGALDVAQEGDAQAAVEVRALD